MRELFALLKFVYIILLPKKFLSWQTCLLTCILLWLLALSQTDTQRDILASLGFLSLIAGLWFFLQERPFRIFGFSLGNWILSLFLAVFIAASLWGEVSYIPWVISPLIAALIAIVPELINSNFKLKLPDPHARARILILLLSHILLSCWIQFHFTINYWLSTQPDLVRQDFSNSVFVVKIQY
ncbi:MAG: DUF5357 domain-containing protein [Desertifilum sp. SIO1I2]|nr:DUF5357 domain-containing protein [Desertifilum sp. SIO1I2]